MAEIDKPVFNDALGEPRTAEDWLIQVGFLIHDCARLRRAVMDDTFRPLSVTRSQAWFLGYLSQAEGKPQSFLADQIGLGKVAIGGLIDRLESSGMIERRRDSVDRRSNHIYLTDRGRQVVKDMRNLTLRANEQILHGLDAEDIRFIVASMSRIKNNLQRMKNAEEA
jgi:MarR family transcriptional regulator, transcriptional regulator for hemolysin